MKKLINLTDENIESLKNEVTHQKPFGPENAGEVRNPNTRWILFSTRNALCEEYKNGPKIIIGRRGSGKSSMLLNTDFIETHDYIISVKTQDALTYVRELAFSNEDSSKVYVETVSELWRTCLNTMVMAEVVAKSPINQLLKVRKFLDAANIDGDSGFAGIIRSFEKHSEAENAKFGTAGILIRSFLDYIKNIEVGFEESLNELDKYLRKSSKDCLVIIDSIEDYALSFDDNKRVMRGLLKCIGEYGNKRRQIRLCIPGETYFDVRKCSSNPTKDFTRNLLLQWLPSEIFGVIAWRYLIYLRLYNAERFDNLIKSSPENDIEDRKFCISVIRDFLVEDTKNAVDKEEPSISYLLRHTQLLPRQAVLILNHIFGSKNVDGDAFADENNVREGIAQAEDHICEEVFSAYEFKYPHAYAMIKSIVPELPRFFLHGELQGAFTKFGREQPETRGEMTFPEFKQMCVEIGMIGRVKKFTETYAEAEFEYACSGRLSLSVKDQLCLHPIFSGTFNSSVNSEGEHVVYPQREWFTDENARNLRVTVSLAEG